MTQGAWRHRYGYGRPRPEFEVQPRGRPRWQRDPDKGPLTWSEGWLRWRIWFAYEMDDQATIDKWQARLVEMGLEPEDLTDVWWRGGLEYGELEY